MRTTLRAALATAVIALGLAGAGVATSIPAQAHDWEWRRHDQWRDWRRERDWRERQWARERYWRERAWRERHYGYAAPRYQYYRYTPPRPYNDWR